jgi:hypothetical protein
MVRGQEIFEKLISPISPEEFFSRYWGKQYLHISRNDQRYHQDVLTFEDVDNYLARADLRYPFIRLVKEGRELPLTNYAHDRVFGENLFQGNLDTDALFREYADGATMCMQLQHLTMPGLGMFTRRIESYFGYRTQSTVFLTPSNSHGFTRHYDSHDFFTMGISGEKTWRVYVEKAEFPLPRTEVLDNEVAISDSVESEFKVKAGDTLYVPRGVYHDARSESGTSIQISLGVFPYYWCDVLHTLVDKLADKHSRLRTAVAPTKSIDAAALRAEFEEILNLVRQESDIASVLAHMQRVSASKCLKDAKNRLRDIEYLRGLAPEMPLRARDIDVRVTEEDGDRLVLSFYDKRIGLPSLVKPQLDTILSGEPFCASSLPGSLDLAGRMLLVGRLVTEGLVTFVGGGSQLPS